jgi:hypothetical protein
MLSLNHMDRLMKRLATVALLWLLCKTSAAAGTPWMSTDYLISGFDSASIGVFDVNFIFQGLLDNSIPNPTGLDFLPDGTLIAAALQVGGSGIGAVANYTPSGTRIHFFTNTQLANPVDIKSDSASHVFVGTQSETFAVQETDVVGSFFQTFGTQGYSGVAVLPGAVLWAGRPNFSSIVDVYDIASGALTGSIVLDAGQNRASSMFYSSTTNTVLMTDGSLAVNGNNKVFERDLNGALIRTFSSPSFVAAGLAGNPSFGVTRGPNGDVLVTTAGGGGGIFHWHSDGTFVGQHNVAGILGPIGIAWAGNANVPEPTTLVMLLIGVVGMLSSPSRKRG